MLKFLQVCPSFVLWIWNYRGHKRKVGDHWQQWPCNNIPVFSKPQVCKPCMQWGWCSGQEPCRSFKSFIFVLILQRQKMFMVIWTWAWRTSPPLWPWKLILTVDVPDHLETVTIFSLGVIDSLAFTYCDQNGQEHSAGPWGHGGFDVETVSQQTLFFSLFHGQCIVVSAVAH